MVNSVRLRAIARKEFLHILRDPPSLAMGVALPVLLLLLFGFALTLDVDRVPLVIWDQSHSQASRAFLSQFIGSRYFAVSHYVNGYSEIERDIDQERALMAMVIPRGFASRVETGSNVVVQLIMDGTDSNTATIALSYAQAIAARYNQSLQIRRIRRLGLSPPRPPLDVRPRIWFNADLQSRNYIVPGLIAVIMAVIGAMLTSLTVAREWERGTMEQLLSTPIRVPEFIFGKLFPYFCIGMFDVVVAVLMGQYLFHVPLRGSVALLLFTSALFLVGVLAQGLVISVITRNQRFATQLSLLGTILPAFLLSGFAFAIANMPRWLQLCTYLISARYFVAILKGVYLRGVGARMLWDDIALLTVFGAVMLLLAHWRFKRRLG